jgi:hypothetical protein
MYFKSRVWVCGLGQVDQVAEQGNEGSSSLGWEFW